jgi:hypothetical protein
MKAIQSQDIILTAGPALYSGGGTEALSKAAIRTLEKL